jgi:hypothetical protein
MQASTNIPPITMNATFVTPILRAILAIALSLMALTTRAADIQLPLVSSRAQDSLRASMLWGAPNYFFGSAVVAAAKFESVAFWFEMALVAGVLGLIVPWLFLLASRKSAAMCAVVSSVVATIAFLVAEITMPKGGDMIRIDIVIFPPLLGLDWLVSFVLLIAAAIKSPPAGPKVEK